MMIRNASLEDGKALASVEEACFPAAEAATESEIKARLAVYPNHFWVLETEGQIIGFIDGMVTEEKDLRDEMYENASLHDEQGSWQMIFGLNTIPFYRRQGCGGRLIRKMIEAARLEGRKGLVLTCKEELLHYYAGFGFVNEGVSQSLHGGVRWYQMRLTL